MAMDEGLGMTLFRVEHLGDEFRDAHFGNGDAFVRGPVIDVEGVAELRSTRGKDDIGDEPGTLPFFFGREERFMEPTEDTDGVLFIKKRGAGVIRSSLVRFLNSMKNHDPSFVCFYGDAPSADVTRFKPVLVFEDDVLRQILQVGTPKLFREVREIIEKNDLDVREYALEHYKPSADFSREENEIFVPWANVKSRGFLIVGCKEKISVFHMGVAHEFFRLMISKFWAYHAVFIPMQEVGACGVARDGVFSVMRDICHVERVADADNARILDASHFIIVFGHDNGRDAALGDGARAVETRIPDAGNVIFIDRAVEEVDGLAVLPNRGVQDGGLFKIEIRWFENRPVFFDGEHSRIVHCPRLRRKRPPCYGVNNTK